MTAMITMPDENVYWYSALAFGEVSPTVRELLQNPER